MCVHLHQAKCGMQSVPLPAGFARAADSIPTCVCLQDPPLHVCQLYRHARLVCVGAVIDWCGCLCVVEDGEAGWRTRVEVGVAMSRCRWLPLPSPPAVRWQRVVCEVLGALAAHYSPRGLMEYTLVMKCSRLIDPVFPTKPTILAVNINDRDVATLEVQPPVKTGQTGAERESRVCLRRLDRTAGV